MVELLIGKKGTGKTKTLLEKVNNVASVADGNIVFISTTNQNSHEIKSCVRMINTTEFEIKSYDEFIGFLSGIISGNFDITNIFVDGIFKIVETKLDGFEKFLERIDAMSKKFNVSFAMTVSIDKDDAPDYVKNYIA